MSKPNVKYLFWRLYHRKFFIFFVALLSAFFVLLVSLFIIKKEYIASTTSYLVLRTEQRMTAKSELNNRKKTLKRYETVFEKESTYQKTIDDLKLESSVLALKKSVVLNSDKTTGNVTIIATSNAPQEASEVANTIRKNVNRQFSNVKVLEEAVPQIEETSPKVLRNTIVSFGISLILTSLLVLGQSMLKMRINTSEDVIELLDVELLGNIPNEKL